MKLPKNWNKMTALMQESWLVKKYQDLIAETDTIRKMMASVRGGNAIRVPEIERPDEALLKE